MKILIFLTACFIATAIPIGTPCFTGDLSCGSGANASLDLLTCDSGTCKGAYLNNQCSPTSPCGSGLFCNPIGICDKCQTGCSNCTSNTFCTSPMPGYFLINGAVTPLPRFCLSSVYNSSYCSTCNITYYLMNGACNACPSNCNYCTAYGTNITCNICATNYWWNTAGTPSCTKGIANCATPTSATACSMCAAGYYYYQDSTFTISCRQGPTNCLCNIPLGTCQTCKSGYFLTVGSANYCGTYINGNTCTALTPNCDKGIDPNTCGSCKANYFLNKNCSIVVSNCMVASSNTTCATCNDGYYALNGTCVKCYIPTGLSNASESGCRLCSGSLRANCTSCQAGYVQVAAASWGCQACAPGCTTCTTNGPNYCDTNGCAAGYWFNSSSKYCFPCDSSCVTCTSSGPSGCASCATNYTLVSSTCYGPWATGCSAGSPSYPYCSACAVGYFGIPPSCTACAAPCNTCTSAAVCTTCIGSGPYTLNANGVCTPGTTIVNCATYLGNGSTISYAQCAKCSATTYASMINSTAAGSCVTIAGSAPAVAPGTQQFTNSSGTITAKVCYDTYWLNGATCSTCTSPCYNCSGSGSTCLSCIANLTTATAAGGFYYFNTNTCVNCGAYCNSCNATRCFTCEYGYGVNYAGLGCFAGSFTNAKYSAANAMVSCIDGYYIGWDNASCTQIPSYANCAQVVLSNFSRATSLLTEFGGPDRCITCNPGYAPAGRPGSAGYVSWNVNYDPCVACGSNCASCHPINVSQCLSCFNGSGNSSGYFLSSNACANQCTTANCLTCPKTIGNCSQCNSGYFFNANNTICSATSDANCNIASGQYMDSCTSCKTGYVKTAQQCYACSKNGGTAWAATCYPPPQDSLNNDINISQATIISCLPGSWLSLVCYGPVTGCNTFISPNICSPTGCSPGWFYNNATGINTCVACSTGCISCINASYCLACDTSGYAIVNNSCTPCTKPCGSCQINSTTCTSCIAGYMLTVTHTCSSCDATGTTSLCNCPAGTYWNGVNCGTCITGCSACSDAVTCTTCFNNYYLDSNTKFCVAAIDSYCDTVYYGNSTGSLSYCRTCAVGYYYDSPTATCPACISKIANCSMCLSATTCTSCATGYYVSGGKCAACNISNCGACSSQTICDQCLSGYYWNTSANQTLCSPCMAGCNYCSNPSACFQCGDGYYQIDTTCYKCPDGCSACKGTSATAVNCTACAPKYIINNSTASCESCYLTCATCSATGTDASNNCLTCVANATMSGTNCKCYSGMAFSKTTCGCAYENANSSGAYLFTGIVTLIVIILSFI